MKENPLVIRAKDEDHAKDIAKRMAKVISTGNRNYSGYFLEKLDEEGLYQIIIVEEEPDDD